MEGSPLLVHTQKFTEKVKSQLINHFDVRWAVRYGRPQVDYHLSNWDINELYIVPLYPQYALSSSQSAINHVKAAIKASGRKIKLKVLKDFYNQPEFIHSQTMQIRKAAEEFKPDHYLLSFHGLPVHHVQKLHPRRCYAKPACCEKVGDSNRWCYRAQSMATARSLKTALISREKISRCLFNRAWAAGHGSNPTPTKW